MYICVSGGKDSTALALLLAEQGVKFEMVYADTGAEFPETRQLLARLQGVVKRPLHILQDDTFPALLERWGYFLPSARRRWCTKYLKQRPLDRFLRRAVQASGGPVTVATGIRVDEPRRIRPSRKKYQNLIYPLVEAGMTVQGVIELCRRYGLLHPIYSWRSNVSCFCCPLQKKSDWLGLREHHPELWAQAVEWEREAMRRGTGFTWRRQGSLSEL